MTVKEVAELLEVSTSLVYGMVAEGYLPHYRVGRGRGQVRIDEADARAYRDKARVEAIAPECRSIKMKRPAPAPQPAGRDGRSTVRLSDAVRARLGAKSG